MSEEDKKTTTAKPSTKKAKADDAPQGGFREALSQAGHASLIVGSVIATGIFVGIATRKLSDKMFGDSSDSNED